MPLDTTTPDDDPFVAAGFTKGPDGKYSAPVGPLTPPAPAAPAAAPAAPQFRPTIDVGPRPATTPAPGQFGSQLTPARPMPGLQIQPPPTPPAPPVAPPTPAVTAPAPAPGGAPATVQVAPPPAVAPPPVAPAVAPPAAPTPPTVAPAQPAETDDPFIAGGFEKKPGGGYQIPGQPAAPTQRTQLPATPPASHPATTASDQPWYQPVWDTVKAIDAGLPASNRDMTHALTMGFDEDVAAFPGALILHYRTGMPLGQAWEKLRGELQNQRHELEQQSQTMSTIGTGVGIGANALLGGGLFSGAKGVLPFLGDVAAGTTMGGVTSFGLSESPDLQQRLDDARKGAEWGGAFTAAIPFVGKIIGGIYRSLRPSPSVDRRAGEMITTAAGGHQPTFEQAPVENFPLGTGGATGEPGLAAIERKAATTMEGNQPAVAIREGQQRAIVEAATTPKTTGVQLASRPPPQLASRLMTPSKASEQLQNAFRRAWQVFKQEEGRLWNTPRLAGKRMDIPDLKQRVANARSALPPRITRQIQNNGELLGALDDITTLPDHATIADINAIRSDLLGIARTAAEPFDRKVAGDMAKELTNAIERNPAMRSDPAALADYLAARNFTRQMWQTIGQKPFRNIIKQGADPRSAGSSLFAFGPQKTGELIPGGVADVVDGLNKIRQEWSALGQSGFSPGVAEAAQRELGQGAVDYIINSMIRPIEKSQTGAEAGQLNRLVQWIDANRGWLMNSRLLVPEQFELLKAIRDSAVMGARVANLRGGRGSETAERLIGGQNARAIDIFSTAMNKHIFSLTGAAIGSYFGHFAEVMAIALGVEGFGPQLLQRLYEAPTEMLRTRLIEAASNPNIARDLMKKAADFKNLSEDTQRWLRAFSAELGAQVEHKISPTTVQ